MLPTLLEIGPFTLRTYGLLIAIGFFFSVRYVMARARARGIPDKAVLDVAFYAILAGIAGGRLMYVMLEWQYYADHLLDVFKIWEGGLVYYGGFVAGAAAVIAYALKTRSVRLWSLADIVAPAIALGHFFGRIGCFAAGCCYGSPTGLPWGVTYCDPQALAPRNVHLHPVQLYEALGNILLFIFLDRYDRRPHREGNTFVLYLALYPLLRFSVEFFRGDDRGGVLLGLSPGQVLSLVLAAAASAIYLFRRKSNAHNS